MSLPFDLFFQKQLSRWWDLFFVGSHQPELAQPRHIHLAGVLKILLGKVRRHGCSAAWVSSHVCVRGERGAIMQEPLLPHPVILEPHVGQAPLHRNPVHFSKWSTSCLASQDINISCWYWVCWLDDMLWQGFSEGRVVFQVFICIVFICSDGDTALDCLWAEFKPQI